ncbi:MAG: ATP-binding cassette domain-containing protein [Planctomycetes bacterium]|nr:ATP-binding cassette domain-containing protein [Planctomycetota bacterium]
MNPIIEVRDLSKSYGPHLALDKLSFAIEKGGVIGLLGINGAGKSTLMRILSCYLQPSAGTARVNGIEVSAAPLLVKQQVSYLPENTPLYPELRVTEFLHYRARLKGIPRARRQATVTEAVLRCGLEGVASRIIGQLSKGYCQRVGLADCLLSDAELLILDEPTVGLDPNQIRDARRFITDLGKVRSVLLSTHILHEVELLCRIVIIIHQGRLLAIDTPQELCRRTRQRGGFLLEAIAAPAMVDSLAKLAGVSEVEEAGRDLEGNVRFRLTYSRERGESQEKDLRIEILKLFSQKGWILQELRTEPVRLEDIFAEITAAPAEVSPQGV